jgi:peptide/nickel transport system permease protein
MSTEDDLKAGSEAELNEQAQSKSELGDQGYSAAGEVGLIKARRTFGERVWRGLKSAPPTALFGLTIIGIYVFFALFAPLLAPYGEAEIFDMSYAPWGEEYMFGTDQLGRDILSLSAAASALPRRSTTMAG